jgi:tetratricopeptide (TPR) repeat protein/KaiC/GvpD/RAD55 family RecA-like ATPase
MTSEKRPRTERHDSTVSTDSGIGFDYDVYVFYAEGDRTSFVDPLCRELKDVGVNAFYDMESIRWGHDRQDELQKGIVKSRRAVLVISETLLSDGALDRRMELSALLDRHQKDGNVLFPLLLGDVKEEQLRKKLPFINSLKAMRTTVTLDGIRKACLMIRNLCSESNKKSSRELCYSMQRRVNLPVLKTGFIGQEPVVNKIIDLLVNDPDCKVCGIGGMPGIGKSSVAVHVAHRLKNKEWRVIFVDCRGLESKEAIAERVMESMLDLSSAGTGVTGMLCSLQEFSTAELKLLVLDQCDKVMDVSQQQQGADIKISPLFDLVSKVLGTTENMKIMTTSRIPFKSCRLPVKNMEVVSLSDNDGAEFLRFQYHMVDQDTDWSIKIAEYCSGHPVALNVVLAIIRDGALSPKEVYHHLHSRGLLKFQQEFVSRIPFEERISYCFTEVLAMLKPTRLLIYLKCLSVFRGPFSLSAAARVVQLDVCQANECAIQPLLERCLLQVSTNAKRYHLPSILREYVRQTDNKNAFISEARNQFFALLTEQLDQIATKFWKDSPAALELLDQDRENYEEVIYLRKLVSPDLLIKFMEVLHRVLPLLKMCLPCLTLSKILKSYAKIANKLNQQLIESQFLIEQSNVFIQKGHPQKALQIAIDAKDVLSKCAVSDKYFIALATCYTVIGKALMAADKPVEALYYHRKSRNIHKRLGNKDNFCIVSLTSLGHCCAEMGLNDEAMTCYKECQNLCRTRLGTVDDSVSNYGFQVRGVHPYQVALLFHMGETASKRGCHADALKFIHQALAMVSNLGASDEDKAAVLYAAGVAALLKGDQEDNAIDNIIAALVLARRQSRCSLLHFFIAFILGKITYTGGNLSIASELLKEAIDAAKDAQYHGDCYVEALAYLCILQNLERDGKASATYHQFNSELMKSHLENLRKKPVVLLLRSSPQFGQEGTTMYNFEPPLATFCCWRYSDFCRWHPNPGEDTLQSPQQLASLSKAAYADPGFLQYVHSVSMTAESLQPTSDACCEHDCGYTPSVNIRGRPKLRKQSSSFETFSPPNSFCLSSNPTGKLPVACSCPLFIDGGITRAKSSLNVTMENTEAATVRGSPLRRTFSRSCPCVPDVMDSDEGITDCCDILDPCASDKRSYWLQSQSSHDRGRLSANGKEVLQGSVERPSPVRWISVPEKRTSDYAYEESGTTLRKALSADNYRH